MFDEKRPEADERELVTASFDPDAGDSLSVTVTEAVARANGVSPEDLDVRLFDAVDPDALEQLFGPTDASVHEAEVRFHMAETVIVVRNTGTVFVRPIE